MDSLALDPRGPLGSPDSQRPHRFPGIPLLPPPSMGPLGSLDSTDTVVSGDSLDIRRFL